MACLWKLCLLMVILPLAWSVPLDFNEVGEGRSENVDDGSWNFIGKLMDDCGDRDLFECVGVKAVVVLGRAARMSNIKLFEGVSFVKTEDDDNRSGRAMASEIDVQNAIEKDGVAQKTARLLDLLLDAATRFLKTHSLQFKMPEGAPEAMSRALEEGRGKKKILKSLMPLILGVGLKLAALIPAGIGLVGLIAAKALLVSKVALILAGILGLQKLLAGGGLSGKGGWGGLSGGTAGWSGAGASTGGWSTGSASSGGYYRSFDEDAHKMAYSAQAPAQ